jgi:5-methylcytosine-specific restriction endonuclease McrA
MSRAVALWIGKTDDTPVPPRVRDRVFEREGGRCHRCTKIIRPGEKWTLEHRKALINGGRNAEDNLCLTCCNCLPAKNADDVAEKSAVATKRKKHVLPRAQRYRWPKRPMHSRGTANVRQIDEDAG